MNPTAYDHIAALARGLEGHGYVADEALATSLFLLVRLRRPLLLEGDAGVGKTEVAQALATHLEVPFIRLQCYEGLDVHSAVYEWNYPRQLLALRIREHAALTEAEKEAHIFGREYLLPRPLLQAVMAEEAPPVLLIDEVDRADEEFEAFLLELLSAFQITIPELGTIRARHVPYVVLTSNRTRELSDALKRRCLYHWMDYPDAEKERRIVARRRPGLDAVLALEVVAFVQALRTQALSRAPGVAETLDWADALAALEASTLEAAVVRRTLGCLLKTTEDLARVHELGVEALLAGARDVS